jgi:hypothetical protein
MEDMEKSTMTGKMNKNSEMILKQKQERVYNENIQIQNQKENEQFDLWPVNMQKNYFEK